MLALLSAGLLVTTFAIADNPFGKPEASRVVQEPAERLEVAKGVSTYLNSSMPY